MLNLFGIIVGESKDLKEEETPVPGESYLEQVSSSLGSLIYLAESLLFPELTLNSRF